MSDYEETELSIYKWIEENEWGSAYPKKVPHPYATFECVECGSLVLNTETHSIWHKGMNV